MNTKERKYTEEFKKQIVELYENGKSVIDQDLRIWFGRTDNLQMDSPLWTICKKWTGRNGNTGWCKSHAAKNSWTWDAEWNPKKSYSHIRQNKVKDKIAFVNKFKNSYPIEIMCSVLDLNRSTYYKDSKRKPTKTQASNDELGFKDSESLLRQQKTLWCSKDFQGSPQWRRKCKPEENPAKDDDF